MLFSEIIKCFANILKNQQSDKNNHLIPILRDLGYYTTLALIKLYSMYNNPYVGDDEADYDIVKHTIEEYEKNLYIFECIYRLDNDTKAISKPDFKNIAVDIIDNEWEDYTNEDIKHFSDIESDKKELFNDLNCMLYAFIISTKYFNTENHTDLQVILEETKDTLGEMRFLIGYKGSLYHISNIKLNKKIKTRRKRIFAIITELVSDIILALKAFELAILEIRKIDKEYIFYCNDNDFYKVLKSYTDKLSKQYKWVIDTDKTINTSNYKELVEDLVSAEHLTIEDSAIIDKDSIEIQDNCIDDCVDEIIKRFEQIECLYKDNSFKLSVPYNIKNDIKSIVSYQYEEDKYYLMNIAAAEIYDEKTDSTVKFPIVLLVDADNNIINQEDIQDYNIANCYDELTSWLTEELENAGIPDGIIIAGFNSFTESLLQKFEKEKKEIAEKLNIKGNVILIDRNSEGSIGDILEHISSMIDDITNPDNSNLSFDPSTSDNNKHVIKTIKDKSNNVIISTKTPFEDPIQYGDYIRDKLLPYIKSIRIQFCMNFKELKNVAECFKEFSIMDELEYYDENNIFSDIGYGQLFQNNSFIMNINYRDILLDSLYIWYSDSDDEYFIGRIFDKINYSVPRVKEWFRQGCKYNTSNGLNLNLCSFAGVANIDLTGLANYIFDEKVDKNYFLHATTILDNSNKRFKSRKLFEISSYIWQVVCNIFTEEYIRDINYRGEGQERRELKYLKYSDNYNISQLIDDFEELIKDGYLDYFKISSLIEMIEINFNQDNRKIKDVEKFDFDPISELFCAKFPNGNILWYNKVFASTTKSVMTYYRIKPEVKYLSKKFYINNEYINEFSIKDSSTKMIPAEDSKAIGQICQDEHHLILIKNIKDSDQFMKDLLSVLKYFKYELDKSRG